MNVTLPELRDRLWFLRGATAVTMVARTNPQMIGGKKCPLAGLEKVARVNGMINWHYGNAVNRQRIRESQPLDENGNVEEFVPQARSWGRRLYEELARPDKFQRLVPLVALNWPFPVITLEQLQKIPIEELYLEYKPESSLEYHYYHNGVEIDKEEAHKHIRPSYQPKTQQTDKEIRLRDYKLVNVEQITLGGEHFVVVK